MNIFREISNKINEISVSDFIKELTERLTKMEQELIIDRFEGEFAVCEDRKTGEMINIEKEKLPNGAKEGSILKFDNDRYVLDEKKEEEIRNRIEEKARKLWEEN